MFKCLQIFILLGFLSFISMPTIFSFFDENTHSVVLFEEEEEQHNIKNLISTFLPVQPFIVNNLYHFYHYFLNEFKFEKVNLKDNLQPQVPTPPPDFI